MLHSQVRFSYAPFTTMRSNKHVHIILVSLTDPKKILVKCDHQQCHSYPVASKLKRSHILIPSFIPIGFQPREPYLSSAPQSGHGGKSYPYLLSLSLLHRLPSEKSLRSLQSIALPLLLASRHGGGNPSNPTAWSQDFSQTPVLAHVRSQVYHFAGYDLLQLH